MKAWSAISVLILAAVAFLVMRPGRAPDSQAPTAMQAPTPEEREAAFQAEIRMENPIAPLNSVWIEELTWIEVRDAMAAGRTTAIIPTGGVEQNGPYVALGKHNYVLEGACDAIARELGNALCTPIIKLVPEGGFEPKTGHMRYPGTLTVRDETFQMMLEDVGHSLHVHGFEHIIYIGDSGGNQAGMAAAAAALNERWGEAKAHHIAGYYDNAGVVARMNELGVEEGPSDGYHDTYWLTSMQMTVDPSTVRYDERVAAGKATINGVSIAPKEETIALGERLMEWRNNKTVELIREAIAGS
ncbi:MAG: creatininase [Gammaproteobacteria bacterium]|nr:creatininase [Gammaproteobacteria bacterium]MYC53926.1 creatininase [Gammaproteobacteria bacterium]